MDENSLLGHRILIVEDEPLIALALSMIIEECGAEISGPAATLDDAMKLAAADSVSAALLDIRLDGCESWPAAKILAERGVPFVFCSGHFDARSLPSEWQGRPILSKPADPGQIIAALADAVTGPV